MQNSTSNDDNRELNEDYLTNLNAIFAMIKNSPMFDDKEPDNRILIAIGSENVYKSIMGEGLLINKLTPEDIEQMRTALNNPQALKGFVKISIGRKIIFHAKNGQVFSDLLGLVPNQAHFE